MNNYVVQNIDCGLLKNNTFKKQVLNISLVQRIGTLGTYKYKRNQKFE